MPHRPRQPRAAAPRRLPSGKWQARVTYWDPDTGKRRETAAAFDRKREAEAWAAEQVRRLQEAPQLVAARDTTLAEYLRAWLGSLEGRGLAPKTVEGYRQMAAHVFAAPAAAKPLAAVTPLDIQAVLQAVADGRSPRTVQYVRTTLRKALSEAVELGLLPSNPVAKTRPPLVRPRPLRVPSPEEVARLLAVAQEGRLAALWLWLAQTGTRRGEALALRWEDIDWDAGVARVQRTLSGSGPRRRVGPPKTPHSRRAIALGPRLLEALREHQRQQDAERAAAGDAWVGEGYVFTTRTGRLLEPRNVFRAYKRLLKQAGLPDGYRLHDLRHAMATAWLAAGENPKVVSERLGHASAGFTLQVYSHVLPHAQAEAAARMERLLEPADPHGIHTSRGDGRRGAVTRDRPGGRKAKRGKASRDAR